ncbi:MAG TPA: GMC family oxidoreductase [Stellaceae bacterium]|nr:GMC family oxidoreductase [Stellaceae bacterium]
MITDARSVPAGAVVDAEICIIGAGAAGITLAREFRASPFRVAVLESGGMRYDPETQELYDGQSIGQPFSGLMSERLRFFGGTTNHWGGWCVPLDAIDFEKRADLPNHIGWPFPRSHLDPWYRRAQAVCRLGSYDYRPADWGIPEKEIPPPFAGPDFACRILQVSPVHFGPFYARELREALRITVYLHANAVNLDDGGDAAAIREVAVETLSGNRFAVRARVYILATGGIENARLLLASGRPDGRGLGNDHDLVGRFFMTHLVYGGGIIVPSNPRMNFDFQTAGVFSGFGGRHSFVPFISLSAASMRRRKLPSIWLHWAFQFAPVGGSVEALKRLIDGEGPGGSVLTDLSAVVGHLEGVADYAVRKALFGEGIPIEALQLHCASEQLPNPSSRITLGATRDRLGMRETVVDWQPMPQDKAHAVATLRLLGQEIGQAGFGRLRSPLVEHDAWPDDFYGNEHHMGTTRMHDDPTQGVVDRNCRMHGVKNLFVAGSSVFPVGGANNPTLTIVALALRLADHVKTVLA